MTQQLITPEPEEATPDATGGPPEDDAVQYREQQRIALRDLVQLATEAATTEAEIERKHQVAIKEADEEFKRASREVEEAYVLAREQVEAEHKEHEQGVTSRIDDSLRVLHAA